MRFNIIGTTHAKKGEKKSEKKKRSNPEIKELFGTEKGIVWSNFCIIIINFVWYSQTIVSKIDVVPWRF